MPTPSGRNAALASNTRQRIPALCNQRAAVRPPIPPPIKIVCKRRAPKDRVRRRDPNGLSSAASLVYYTKLIGGGDERAQPIKFVAHPARPPPCDSQGWPGVGHAQLFVPFSHRRVASAYRHRHAGLGLAAAQRPNGPRQARADDRTERRRRHRSYSQARARRRRDARTRPDGRPENHRPGGRFGQGWEAAGLFRSVRAAGRKGAGRIFGQGTGCQSPPPGRDGSASVARGHATAPEAGHDADATGRSDAVSRALPRQKRAGVLAPG